MSDIKNHFFSKENMDLTYGIVQQNVNHKCDYNIDRSPKLREGFHKLAQVVYNKTDDNNLNLTILNQNLVEQCASHFIKIVEKKKGRTNVSGNTIDNRGESTRYNYNNTLGMSMMADNNDISRNLETIEQQRNNDMIRPDLSDEPHSKDSRGNNQDMRQKYQGVVNSRTDNISREERTNTTGRQMAEIYEANNPMHPFDVSGNSTDYNINTLPFTTSDDFINDMVLIDAKTENSMNSIDRDVMYNNMDELKQMDGQDPMQMLDAYKRNRDTMQPQMDTQTIEKMMDTRPMDNLNGKRNQDIIDARVDTITNDPRKMMLQKNDITNRMIDTMTTGTISDNDPRAMPDRKTENDRVLNKLVDFQVINEPRYIDKVHYVNVNSLDRNWQSQQESRYQFKVNFKSSDTQNNAAVSAIFRNIVSVELINAILPVDNEPVVFDSRIYLSTHRHPYLLLHIEELNGVFYSTNSASDKVFSQMIFDKEYNTTSISSDYVSSDVAPLVDTRFATQFKRGYLRYIPAFFEKKNYYDNPRASLNRMTINITDLYGNNISSQGDVLEISAITTVDAIGTDYELTRTDAFPNTDCSSNYNKYIQITTLTHFTNRIFRIGDTIRFSDISSDNTTLDTYMNRTAGHVIVNLEAEVSTGSGDINKSFLDKIYIAPPGDLDTSNEALNTSTYIDASTATFSTFTAHSGATARGYLVNQSLQTNIMLKFVTRDVDTGDVIKTLNV